MLKEKIENKKALMGIIGLGYVGLPLQVLFAKNGFSTIGLDRKKERVDMVNSGESYIQDVQTSELKQLVQEEKVLATTEYGELKRCDVVQICVPTPIDQNKVPILNYVIHVTESLREVLHKEELVMLKSTTFPETTEKVVLPILEESGLTVGNDFYLAFSPERIDPGNKVFTVENTPVVVGGVTKKCTQLAKLLYEKVIETVFPVSSPKAAELTKLLENTFRNVNIAMVNEFALLCERMGINIWEVIDAASTKPFGFMPFYPGPGVGGHCIPIDPYYLSHKAREYDFHMNFIELSGEVNERMPYYVADKVIKALSRNGICASKAKVFLLGVAFKKDVGDLRDSPSLKVFEVLKGEVNEIIFNDPFVNEVCVSGESFKSIPICEENLKSADCVLITTDHSCYDYDLIVENAQCVIDTRNATKNVKAKRGNVVRLGT